jgi:hypothetical protein
MRITVTLDDEVHEHLVKWAKADRRSIASTAAMLIEFALTNDENALLRVPDVIEEGRRLASQRDDLIAQGVPASELAVPLAPVKVPEPKPSKAPQQAVQVPIARQTEEGAPKVVDTHREFLEQRGPEMLDHPFVGTGPGCKRMKCPDPKNRAAHRG